MACAATPALLRPVYLRLESGVGGRGPTSEGQLLFHSLMQRGAEQRSLCGWHLCFARILRVRRLSARNPGPASPVETYHPRTALLYPEITGLVKKPL